MPKTKACALRAIGKSFINHFSCKPLMPSVRWLSPKPRTSLYGFGSIEKKNIYLTCDCAVFAGVVPIRIAQRIVVKETSDRGSTNQQIDVRQAEMVLSLLRSSVDGNINPQMIESVGRMDES